MWKKVSQGTPPPPAAVPLPFQGRLFLLRFSHELGSPLGHPKGVPCAELAPQVTEGLSRKSIT